MNSRYLFSVLAFTMAIVLVAFFMTLIVLLPQLWQTDSFGNSSPHPMTTSVFLNEDAQNHGLTLKTPTYRPSKEESVVISPQVAPQSEPAN